MTWSIETKTQDIAPTKRGEEWKSQTSHFIRDERGRLVVVMVDSPMDALFPDMSLSADEKADAARLIAAAPALRDALELALHGLEAHCKQGGPLFIGDALAADKARAALALLDANARAEVAA